LPCGSEIGRPRSANPIVIAPSDRTHRGSVLLGLSLALLLAATLLAVTAHPASAKKARPFFTGITNLDTNAPLAFERTRAAGAGFVRIPLHWDATAPDLQPASWQPDDPRDPRYRWDNSDEAVVQAVRAGLTPVLQVNDAPTWAQRCTSPAVLPSAICDPDPAALAAFATAAASRYSGHLPGLPRVQYWQGLNEPNLSLFFFPQFNTEGKALSPDLYRTLINSFYSAVKAVDGSNLVISAGLGPIEVPPWTMGPMHFARLLLCMKGTRNPRPLAGDCGGGVHFDIFAIQPYTTGSPEHEGRVNDVQLGDLPKLQTLLKAADRADRIRGQFPRTPLWVTEFSWDSQPPDPGGLPMAIETRWTAEALHRAWSAGVSNFFWFSLRDGVRDSSRAFSNTLESGLYFRGATVEQDDPKEVLYAFRFPLVAYPLKKGLSFWGRTPSGTGGKLAIQVWERKRWRRLLVTRADKYGVFHGLVRSRYGNNKRGRVRAVYRGDASIPFSMRPVKDFYQEPFG
jgi:hypothetical protein